MRLGVLDQSPIPQGLTAGDALANSIDLARLADSLGYERYWAAEHHGTPGLACHSPEILISAVGAATQRIRVGSGGVMLPHYSPLKVAENFGMLEGLYPGRIDLGIGRAAGTSPAVTFALQRDRRQASPDDFPDQLEELFGYFGLTEDQPALIPQLRCAALRFSAPEIWLLGSSLQSAIWAAELGLAYCFADFINPNGAEIASHYLRNFQPSKAHAAPQLAVATWAVCAQTDEAAEDLSSSARMMLALLHRGELIAVPSVEEARRFLERERGSAEMLGLRRRFITGTPSRVRKAIESLASDYGAGEVLLVNILHDHRARRRSYELVAEEFALPGNLLQQHAALAG